MFYVLSGIKAFQINLLFYSYITVILRDAKCMQYYNMNQITLFSRCMPCYL